MIQPTTLFLGEKASQLLKELAADNDMASRYFFTKIIIREAKAEAAALTSDRLEARLKLIDEVSDELADLISNPPQDQLNSYEYSTEPKKIYAKIWEAHRRLKRKGWGEAEIHDYCLTRYGMDIKIKKTPTKNPKQNPEWVGGGPVAGKIKKAKEVSRKIEVEDGE